MNVLVLAPYPAGIAPCQRYRFEQWWPFLEREGIHLELDGFMSRILYQLIHERGRVVAKAVCLARDYGRALLRSLGRRRYDAILLHREAAIVGPAWLERLAARTGIPIVYDFDDAIYVPYVSPFNGYLSYFKFPSKTAAICRMARHVMVGNDLLRRWALEHNPRVTVVPSTINLDEYRPSGRYAVEGEPVIGWTGSYSSVQYLDLLRPALTELARRRSFRFEVISSAPVELAHVPVQSRRWRAETEAADLAGFDIGVMPLPDESWARGKCALKALQYMALAIPTVVSPVGVNREVVRDGENGLHASSTQEWVEALERLLDDETLRRRLGQAGRRTVEDSFSAQVQAPRVARILESVVAGRGRFGEVVR